MRHLPFLKALANVSDVDDPVWRDAAGGYLVLRFFDQWLEEGPAMMSASASLLAIQSQIQAISNLAPHVQDLLLTALERMVNASEADPSLVAGPLLAYGKYLESAGQPDLAAHFYRVLIDELDSPRSTDPLCAAAALMRYGFVTRFLGDFTAADAAYRRAHTIATQANARMVAIRATIGLANNLRVRGNLGEAEELLNQLLAQAVESAMADAESLVLNARASIRVLKERYVDAMLDFFRAYKLTEDEAQREVILGDLAGCAWDAGYHHMARDTYRILAYTAREPLVRSAALGNLLEVAAYDGTAADFERIRTHIAAHAEKYSLPAEHVMHIALYTAYGVERFGTRDEAIATYRSVIAEAHKAGFHRIEFKAEERLTALMAGTQAQDNLPVHEPPDTLRSIVDAIAGWSALVVAPV